MAKSIYKLSTDEESEINALLVIDVQKGLFNKTIPIFKADELISNNNFLAEKAHENHVPVIYIQHPWMCESHLPWCTGFRISGFFGKRWSQ